MSEGAKEGGRVSGRMSRRTAAWLAWALATLTVVFICCIMVVFDARCRMVRYPTAIVGL